MNNNSYIEETVWKGKDRQTFLKIGGFFYSCEFYHYVPEGECIITSCLQVIPSSSLIQIIPNSIDHLRRTPFTLTHFYPKSMQVPSTSSYCTLYRIHSFLFHLKPSTPSLVRLLFLCTTRYPLTHPSIQVFRNLNSNFTILKVGYYLTTA